MGAVSSGRTPRGAADVVSIIENPELEAEAERYGTLAQSFAVTQEELLFSAWRSRLRPPIALYRSVLRRDNKVALFQALEDLVKQIPPKTGFDLTPTRRRSSSSSWQTRISFLVKVRVRHGSTRRQTARHAGRQNTSYQIKVGRRIFLSALDHNDRKWILKTLKKLAAKHRFPNDYTKIRTQIVSDGDNQWVDWTSSDCVFTAILIVLGLRFKGRGEPVEGHELQVETDLANLLAIPKRTIPDHLLVVLLEERLGWTRLGAGTLAELYAEAKSGDQYVVSYCENERTDFWHTVYGRCKGKNSWEWVDRQYERKFGPVRQSLKGDLACEANAWLIDDTAPLVGTLRVEMQVNTLKTTYKAYID